MLKTRIRKHEVGLRFRYGDFERLLQSGLHWSFGRLLGRKRVQIEVVDTLNTRFEHKLLDLLVKEPEMQKHLLIVDLTDEQRALVWKDDRLGWILGPGRHAFWRRPHELRVETFEVSEPRFQHARIQAVLQHAVAPVLLEAVRIEAHERGLLFREGELVETLGPGLHVFWKQAGKIVCRTIDLREQVAEVAGQEIMTADKVTLRVNLVVTYQVVDPVKAVGVVADAAQTLYRAAQLALRGAVGTRRIDDLLADKEAVGGEVRKDLTRRAAEFGVTVRDVGLRDVILPGDMKTILNQVIEAQKRAEANLIRRREETAAARSQANTARLLAENPVLARMKELEGLQEILAGAKTTFILGRGDLVEQLRALTRQTDDED